MENHFVIFLSSIDFRLWSIILDDWSISATCMHDFNNLNSQVISYLHQVGLPIEYSYVLNLRTGKEILDTLTSLFESYDKPDNKDVGKSIFNDCSNVMVATKSKTQNSTKNKKKKKKKWKGKENSTSLLARTSNEMMTETIPCEPQQPTSCQTEPHHKEIELGLLLDRRIIRYFVPVFSFVLLYSKLPHKELRFIIGSVPIFNVSAAIAASRVYNNQKKNIWRLLFLMMLGSLLASLGCSAITFMASYSNYPGGYALKALHQIGDSRHLPTKMVHIDSFTAMSGISRFSEEYPWRYSKEEGIAMGEYRDKMFTFLLNELPFVDGYKCLFAVNGFSRVHLQNGFPLFSLLKEPKVFVHGNMRDQDIFIASWPGCP